MARKVSVLFGPCTLAACRAACDDDRVGGYECSYCLCVGTVRFCERFAVCNNSACDACAKTAAWSPEPYLCAACTARPAPAQTTRARLVSMMFV